MFPVKYKLNSIYYLDYRATERSGTDINCTCSLHYMVHMIKPIIYAFSELLCLVCADFAQHIGKYSSTIGYNSLPKVKFSHVNSIRMYV
jgi:hypothetical protein